VSEWCSGFSVNELLNCSKDSFLSYCHNFAEIFLPQFNTEICSASSLVVMVVTLLDRSYMRITSMKQ
jgi:hypothetical protein